MLFRSCASGKVVPRWTVKRIPAEHYKIEPIKKLIDEFNSIIEEKFAHQIPRDEVEMSSLNTSNFVPYEDDEVAVSRSVPESDCKVASLSISNRMINLEFNHKNKDGDTIRGIVKSVIKED